jgi:hypothetical protein
VPALVASNGPLAGQRLSIDGELTIGRADANVVIEDPKLSRLHAVFRVVGDGLEVEDLGSTNGTFVEERRIDVPTQLEPGARVRLGATVFMAELELSPDRTQVSDPHTEAARGADATVIAGNEPEPATAAASRPASTAPPDEPAAPRVRTGAPVASPPAGHPAALLAAFQPPAVRRGGLATRSWVPVALSYGSAIAVAIALVVYFASR